MSIQSGSRVELHYELYDEEGNLVESTSDEGPVRYVHGRGEILPGLERALEGRGAGESLDVELDPEDAYGSYDPDGLVSLPREELPDLDLARGDWVSVHVELDDGEDDEDEDLEDRAADTLAEDDEDGDDEEDDDEEADDDDMEMRVVEVSGDEVVLDANHPLAGQRVRFHVTVTSVG